MVLVLALVGFSWSIFSSETYANEIDQAEGTNLPIPASHNTCTTHEWEPGLQHQWREWKYHLFIEVNRRLKLLARKSHISLSNHKPSALAYTITSEGKIFELRFLSRRSDEKYESLVLCAMNSTNEDTRLKFPEGTSYKWISDYYTFGLTSKKDNPKTIEKKRKKDLKDFMSGKTNSYSGFDFQYRHK